MKKNVIFLVIIVISTCLFSQEETKADNNKKNQLNIGYFNAFKLNNLSDFGLGFKHTFNNSAIRIGSSLYYLSTEYSSENNSYINNKTEFKVRPRIGYEFHQNYNKLQFIYGIDITGLIENTVTKSKMDNYPDDIYKTDYNNYGIGMSPLIGLKYQINNKISITSETNLDVLVTKSESKSGNNGYDNISKSIQSYVNLNPLGIFSINYHF